MRKKGQDFDILMTYNFNLYLTKVNFDFLHCHNFDTHNFHCHNYDLIIL